MKLTELGFYTTTEAAKLIGVNRRRISELCETNEVTYVKLGNRYWLSPATVDYLKKLFDDRGNGTDPATEGG